MIKYRSASFLQTRCETNIQSLNSVQLWLHTEKKLLTVFQKKEIHLWAFVTDTEQTFG